jgi:hypothetical protein
VSMARKILGYLPIVKRNDNLRTHDRARFAARHWTPDVKARLMGARPRTFEVEAVSFQMEGQVVLVQSIFIASSHAIVAGSFACKPSFFLTSAPNLKFLRAHRGASMAMR